MLNGVGSVAIQVAGNQRHLAENALHWADVKRQHLFRSPFIQHGNTFPLQAAVQSQEDWFKGVEEHQGKHPTSGAQVQLRKSCCWVGYWVHITLYLVQSEWTSTVHSAHLNCFKDADAIWWWAWLRNRKYIKGPLQTFFYAFQKVRHIAWISSRWG